MRNYVTQISLKDFLKLHPGLVQDFYLKDDTKASFPLAIAIHSKSPHEGYYGRHIGCNVPVIVVDHAKHIYCTRDYFEITCTNKATDFRYKVPKKEPKSIYLVIAEDE